MTEMIDRQAQAWHKEDIERIGRMSLYELAVELLRDYEQERADSMAEHATGEQWWTIFHEEVAAYRARLAELKGSSKSSAYSGRIDTGESLDLNNPPSGGSAVTMPDGA